jgi:Predicted glycosyltransferases
MNPELSIIMPVYNGGRYLNDSIGALESVKLDWELLILDDASTDNTKPIIEKITEKNKRIRAFYSSQNRGVSEARNFLVKESQSNILLILDADNVLDKDNIDKMYEMLKSKNIDVVCTEKLNWITSYSPLIAAAAKSFGDGWVYSKYGQKIDLSTAIRALDIPLCSGNYMFTRKVFDAVNGYHNEDYHEAWGFGFRHVAAGYSIWICPGTYYNHRVCSGNYERLPKTKIQEAMWNRLNDIRDRFTEDTVHILDTEKNGSKIISSEALKLK